ncbi:hypothetical protein [Streptomyces sp. AM6-12]
MNDGRSAGVRAVIDAERGAHGALEPHGPLDTALRRASGSAARP